MKKILVTLMLVGISFAPLCAADASPRALYAKWAAWSLFKTAGFALGGAATCGFTFAGIGSLLGLTKGVSRGAAAGLNLANSSSNGASTVGITTLAGAAIDGGISSLAGAASGLACGLFVGAVLGAGYGAYSSYQGLKSFDNGQ